MKNEGALIPSKTRDRYWIDAENPSAIWSDNSGKWLLFIPSTRVDHIWKIIRVETEAGRLGSGAKVATDEQNPLATSRRTKLICVYTYNSEDLEDVRRVRQRLRDLGFSKKLPYKTDAATTAGKYTKRGDKKVSMLYE